MVIELGDLSITPVDRLVAGVSAETVQQWEEDLRAAVGESHSEALLAHVLLSVLRQARVLEACVGQNGGLPSRECFAGRVGVPDQPELVGELFSFAIQERERAAEALANTQTGPSSSSSDLETALARAKRVALEVGLPASAPLGVKYVSLKGSPPYYSPRRPGADSAFLVVDSVGLQSAPAGFATLLAIHEGWVGHHLLAAAPRQRLHRVLVGLSDPALGEGWATYAEELAFELGAFLPSEHNAYWRHRERLAILVSLDIGLHAFGWSTSKAIEWALASDAAVGIAAARDLVGTARRQPGRVSAYLLGANILRRLSGDPHEPPEVRARNIARVLVSPGPLTLSGLSAFLGESPRNSYLPL
jgi:hypothetical protein